LRIDKELHLSTKEIISVYIPFVCSNIPAAPVYGVHISDIPEIDIPNSISLIGSY
jgi:hypothetical protein